MKLMLSEVKILLEHVNNKDYEKTKETAKISKHLFRWSYWC